LAAQQPYPSPLSTQKKKEKEKEKKWISKNVETEVGRDAIGLIKSPFEKVSTVLAPAVVVVSPSLPPSLLFAF